MTDKPPFYNYLGRPADNDLTEDQQAILAAREEEIGIELAFGSSIPGEIGATLAWIDRHGWWVEIKTPFEGDGTKLPHARLYWVGLTPHSTSGWGGRPDHQVGDVTLRGALWRAILLMLVAEKWDGGS